MIPVPTNKSKKNNTTSKSHVSDATVPDSIIFPIIESSLLAADFAEVKGIIARLQSKIDNYITWLTVLEAKLLAPPDLQQTPDSSFLSLSDANQQFSNRLTHCELNHDTVVPKFSTIRKMCMIFSVWGLPPTVHEFFQLPISFSGSWCSYVIPHGLGKDW